MNRCVKCDIVDTDLVVCDKCNSRLCQNCTQLTSTELRAVVLKKRLIFYWCFECKKNEMPMKLIEEIPNKLKVMAEDIKERFNALQAQVTTLHTDLVILKETNISVISLLENNNKTTDTQMYQGNTSTSKRTQVVKNSQEEFRITNSLPNCANPNIHTHPSTSISHSNFNVDTKKTPIKTTSDMTKPRRTSINTNSGFNLKISSVKKRNVSIVGTKKIENTKLTAARLQPKTSLQVRKLDISVTEEDLYDHLKSTFGQTEQFKIEKLTVKSGDYASYRIEFRADLLEDVLNASNWPEDIEVRRFNFFRPTPKNNSLFKYNRRIHTPTNHK